MGLVAKIIGGKADGNDTPKEKAKSYSSLADGALDSLGSIFQVMGEESFPLEQDIDPSMFRARCAQFVGHIENGAAVPDFGLPQSADGTRDWAQLRRFFADRRRAERIFVTERLHSYREVVEDLIGGLRQIGERDQYTESRVKVSLARVEEAVVSGSLPDIKAALEMTVQQVTETFAEQKNEYETQLGELNSRMSNLRQDLVAAREEMKRDPLTDAFNRGAFDRAIEQSLNLHFVLNQAVTLVMVDLDNFKQVNDNHGHAAGDNALRAVGECLERSFIRKGDLVARYGGDEFAVILNDTSAAHATRLVEGFLQRVNDIKVGDLDEEVSISCSAGYTEVVQQDSVQSLIKRADKALYEAKAAGRNAAKMLLHPDGDKSD